MVMLSYLTPINPGMAMSNTLPPLPDNGFSAYAIHHQQQQHPFVNEPTAFDIQLGKEKNIFNHSGNRRFRTMINNQLETYIAAPTKSSKSKLIRQVHADMQKSGYRFLRRNSTTGIWYEIEKHEAREKVSHALRDRVREQQKPNKRRRKIAVCETNPASPTSVVPIKEISLNPVQKPKQQQQHQQVLSMPTLCNHDLTINKSSSRSFFEVITSSTDVNDLAFKSQRRGGVLSSNDDYPVSDLTKANRHLSFMSINESSSNLQRRLSLSSIDDVSCNNAIRRLNSSLVEMLDVVTSHTNPEDHNPCAHLEPYSLDDEFYDEYEFLGEFELL